MWKTITIIAVTLAFSCLFWLGIHSWFVSDVVFKDYNNWLLPLILLCLLAPLCTLSFALLSKPWHKVLVVAGIALSYAVSTEKTPLMLLGMSIIVMFMYWAIRNIEHEVLGRVTLHPSLIARRGINQIVFPILICVSFAFFQSPALLKKAETKELPETFKTAIAKSVDTLLTQSDGPQIDEETKNSTISHTFDVVVAFAEPYRHYFPPLLAFGLFMVLWGASFVIRYISIAITVIWFEILKRLNFFKIIEKEVKVQTIELN